MPLRNYNQVQAITPIIQQPPLKTLDGRASILSGTSNGSTLPSLPPIINKGGYTSNQQQPPPQGGKTQSSRNQIAGVRQHQTLEDVGMSNQQQLKAPKTFNGRKVHNAFVDVAVLPNQSGVIGGPPSYNKLMSPLDQQEISGPRRVVGSIMAKKSPI